MHFGNLSSVSEDGALCLVSPSSEAIEPDLPQSIGSIAVRLVAEWSRPRVRVLRPAQEQETPDGASN